MPELVNQPSIAPSRKMSATGLGLSAAVILSWLLHEIAGVDVPPGVEAAFASLAGFGAGYFTRERS